MEDDQHEAILVRQALAKLHPAWHLEFATHGQMALERLAVEPFDAVLLDHGLPDMKGLAVLREIQDRKLDVPVVFQVAFGNETMAAEAMEAGAYDYVQKSDPMYSHLGKSLLTCIQIQKIKRTLRSSHEEEVRTERQSALAQLSLTVRHEINNPLAALCGYTELLLQQVKDKPELRRRVQQIYDEAIRIRDVVRKTENVKDEVQDYLPGMKMIRLSDTPDSTEKK